MSRTDASRVNPAIYVPTTFFELAKIAASGRLGLDRGPLMDQPESVDNFLVGKLAGLEHEVMAVLFLDSRLKLICYVEMFSGSLNQAAYPSPRTC